MQTLPPALGPTSNYMPAPQAYITVAPDATPASHSADSFSVSNDKLFKDIGRAKVGDARNPQVSSVATVVETSILAPIEVIPIQTLPPALGPTLDYMPAPQAYIPVAPDATPASHSADSFSVSNDELFKDFGRGIGGEVIGPPGA
ncbi:unnamed protein product [Ilex paraguariensis]|uniref:Uncharacterized protein n=1 Tax=Ilex paraguariensis TaxID=185542 RepID=A0ABC8SHI3_9AQUA